MRIEELKEYLGIVVDMEKNIYLQERLVASLTKKISTLGHPQSFVAPVEQQAKLEHSASIFDGGLSTLVVGGVFGFLISIPISSVFFPDDIVHSNYVFICMTIGSAILCLIWVLSEISQDAAREKEANDAAKLAAKQSYHKELSKYRQACTNDAIRVQNELCAKACHENILQQLQAQLVKSKHDLEQIYASNIIFPKYRNLVMVSSLYEYLCSGRCTALEGHEGAYNILEMEIRLDRIITQLDQVISRLDQIRSNQYMLYSAIQDANQQSAPILESTDLMAASLASLDGQAVDLQGRIAQLQQSSALTAYCSERTQKELAYMNRMNYLTGRNDGVFWNVPPT